MSLKEAAYEELTYLLSSGWVQIFLIVFGPTGLLVNGGRFVQNLDEFGITCLREYCYFKLACPEREHYRQRQIRAALGRWGDGEY